jgi:hypothetical protein
MKTTLAERKAWRRLARTNLNQEPPIEELAIAVIKLLDERIGLETCKRFWRKNALALERSNGRAQSPPPGLKSLHNQGLRSRAKAVAGRKIDV